VAAKKESVTGAQPMFLIAIPQLGDPNFVRSVVLMLHHAADGALGLIVNHPIELTLGSFANEHGMACHSRVKDIPVFRGGPVDPTRGWILHEDGELSERQDVLPGLSVSGSLESLTHLLAEGRGMRLLLGYAGWGPGQLEREMQQGSWLTVEADAKHVLLTPASECWNAVLREMGVDPARLAMGTGIH
jgi:putative transcriptional regulator